jgi:hypothetical protein
VFRLDRQTAALDAWVLDEAKTFFGVWGPGDGTAWAVGGDATLPSDASSAWYFDGADWAEVELPAEIASQYAIYKVWGSSPSDVWCVGTAGTSMHWDGTSWTFVDTVSYVNLFTVNDGYAVGGDVSGTILHLSETGMVWANETPEYTPQTFGVYGGETPTVVGSRGAVYQRTETEWVPDPRERPTYQDLHSVWIDPEGGIWAAGGHFSSAPLIQGALVYGGGRTIPALLAD